MHVLITIGAVILVLAGVFYTRVSKPDVSQEQVLSIKATPVETVVPIPTASPKPHTPVPTQQLVSPDSSGSYHYPGSQTVSVSGSVTVLTTGDDPEKVTDWYKNKIRSRGMSVTSFVVTKTNNNVFNKLAGASAGKKIEFEIKKAAGDPVVTITVKV